MTCMEVLSDRKEILINMHRAIDGVGGGCHLGLKADSAAARTPNDNVADVKHQKQLSPGNWVTRVYLKHHHTIARLPEMHSIARLPEMHAAMAS